MALIAGMVLLIAVPVLVTQAGAALPTPPTFNFVLDENGKDDQPGQKDLSAQAVATPAPGELWTSWLWDVTSLSGGNTGDACSLFDTDTDGKVNFAVCVTIEKNPAVQAAVSPRVYTCGDGKVDRCTSTYTEVPKLATECETNTNANDPFHAGQKDTQAICKIDLAAVGGPGTANLVNVCSYPSQTPTSDPSDCVLIPRDAFIVIEKTASPTTTGTQFPFRLGPAADATQPIVFTATNSQTSSPIPIRSGINYKLKEDTPANWAVTGTPSCSGASGSGTSNGTFASPDTINTIKAASDNVITCRYTNTQLTGAIRIIKQRTGTTVKLNGAHFSIDDAGDHITGSGTNATGTVCVEGIALGNHNVKETAAPNGHSNAVPDNQDVNVDSAGTCASGAKEVTFNNALVPGTINITKTGVDGPLGGAKFTLYDDKDSIGGTRTAADTITNPVLECTTSSAQDATEGKCTISNVPVGEYWLVETITPDGYSTRPDLHVTIDVGSSPGAGDVEPISITNQPVNGTIIIHKTGNGGLPLKGATFELFTRNPQETVHNPLSGTGKTCSTTGAGNVYQDCVIEDVALGEYWLVETITPAGYSTVPDEPVTVGLGSDDNEGDVIEVTLNDPVVKGTINITKTGLGGAPLGGATFTLYTDNPTVGGSRQGNDLVTDPALQCTTSSLPDATKGKCSISNVPLGNYWVVETGVPAGYTAAPDQAVNVGVGGAMQGVGDVDNLTFVNEAVDGTVEITKTDDAGNLLEGAVFVLHNDNPTVGGSRQGNDTITSPLLTCTTGANGTCTIEDVPVGRYWAVESSAPNSHYVKAADQEVNVELGPAADTGDTVELDFVNERKHRVVVVVCHEGTNTVFSRNVTVNGDTKASRNAAGLDAAAQAALCNTGGASFGDIAGHGTVTAAVDLGAGP